MQELTISTFVRIAWLRKKTIILCFFVVSSLAIVLALLMQNIYRTEVVLVPAMDSGKGLNSRIGGLAALAGVNVNDGESSKVAIAIETLKSKDFLYMFVSKRDYLTKIMAVDKWDSSNNTIVIDGDKFDEKTNKWIRKAQFPKVSKPSNFELAEYLEKRYSVVQDRINGTIKISFEHNSPYFAKEFLENIVAEINEFMRQKDIVESAGSLKYLEEQLIQTKNEQMRNALTSLIEEQLKIKMLAEVRKQYVFKILDPAYFPDTKEKPKRAIIVSLVSFFGTLFLSIVVVSLHIRKTNRELQSI